MTNRTTNALRQQARRTGQQARALTRRAGREAISTWRRLPVSAATRRKLTDPVLWPDEVVRVPIERILLGGQNELDAHAFAVRSGDLLWPSTRVQEGPHAALLRTRAEHGGLSDDDILTSQYAAMARICIEASGHYFGAVDDAGILRLVRESEERGLSGEPVMLVPVKGSDCYQVVDGHHRVAAAAMAGETRISAKVRRGSVTTPLQEHLDRMSWIGGKRELYQPVDAPELEQSWPTVRRCDDRLELMDKQLADLGLVPEESTYLDVASAYGWFVGKMAQRGYTASGVERDPEAAVLGRAIYGLRPGQISTADVVDFLHDDPGTWDVVSCFSLLHHFALGRGSVDETALFRMLDRATGRVLFIDTGMAHEAWFRESLPEWDLAYLREFLETVGTFDRVVDLGPDRDAVPPYAANYARHLFACIRDE